MQRINVEIKAKCTNPEKIRAVLGLKNAQFKGTDHQIDTYYNILNKGARMKIREGNIENFLIYYERKDTPQPKKSDVILFDTEPYSPLGQILEKSLGVLATIDKEREIYVIENMKFHVDKVKDLGTFIEIEASDSTGIGESDLLEQCKQYMRLFDVKDEDLVEHSYSDMILAAKAQSGTV
jgi:predicted adenylyl cyclase CyaB